MIAVWQSGFATRNPEPDRLGRIIACVCRRAASPIPSQGMPFLHDVALLTCIATTTVTPVPTPSRRRAWSAHPVTCLTSSTSGVLILTRSLSFTCPKNRIHLPHTGSQLARFSRIELTAPVLCGYSASGTSPADGSSGCDSSESSEDSGTASSASGAAASSDGASTATAAAVASSCSCSRWRRR